MELDLYLDLYLDVGIGWRNRSIAMIGLLSLHRGI